MLFCKNGKKRSCRNLDKTGGLPASDHCIRWLISLLVLLITDHLDLPQPEARSQIRWKIRVSCYFFSVTHAVPGDVSMSYKNTILRMLIFVAYVMSTKRRHKFYHLRMVAFKKLLKVCGKNGEVCSKGAVCSPIGHLVLPVEVEMCIVYSWTHPWKDTMGHLRIRKT